MKRNMWFIMITVVTIFCVTGGTFYHLGSGWMAGGTHYGRGTAEQDIQLEAFTGIDVEADLIDLSITEGDSYHLQYQYKEGCVPEYKVKDGTLVITQELPFRRSGGWHGNDKCSLSVTVPVGADLDAIDIQTSIGDIYIGEVSASQCEIENDLGDCTIEKSSFGSFDVYSALGDTKVSDTDLGDASMDDDMGDIVVERCTFDDLEIDASAGNVRVDTEQDLNGYQLDLGTSLGNVTVNGSHEGTSYFQRGDGKGSLRLWADMGNVKLDHGK